MASILDAVPTVLSDLTPKIETLDRPTPTAGNLACPRQEKNTCNLSGAERTGNTGEGVVGVPADHCIRASEITGNLCRQIMLPQTAVVSRNRSQFFHLLTLASKAI